MAMFKRPDISPLKTLSDRSDGRHPSHSLIMASMESVAMSSNIKRESVMSVELFDDAIRKAVNEFYEFSRVYRDGNAGEFVNNVKTLDSLLKPNDRKFRDTIRWSDDEKYIDTLRQPVSTAYLNLFGDTNANRQVVPDDFWKCLDLEQLRLDLYKTSNFRSVSTIFTLKKSFDKVNKLLALVTELRLAIVTLSDQYEKTISDIIDQLSRGQAIPVTDTINFNRPESVILGNVLSAVVTTAINTKWYGNAMKTNIGSMGSDTKLLLEEPLELCTPENSDTPEAVEHFFKYAKLDHVAENIGTLQKEFLNIVEQIDLSSKRLSKLSEGLVGVSDYNDAGGYNYSLRDVSLLMHVYSHTLSELLQFIVKVAITLEDSFQETADLTDKVRTLKLAIDTYVSKRIKQ